MDVVSALAIVAGRSRAAFNARIRGWRPSMNLEPQRQRHSAHHAAGPLRSESSVRTTTRRSHGHCHGGCCDHTNQPEA